jgi:hypothetical protein
MLRLPHCRRRDNLVLRFAVPLSSNLSHSLSLIPGCFRSHSRADQALSLTLSCTQHFLFRLRAHFFISMLLTCYSRMPGSQWSSRSSSRTGSNPGSGAVTRVSSASSVVVVSSTEVSRTSSASSLRRALLRSRSGSSVDSLPFPRCSPFEPHAL